MLSIHTWYSVDNSPPGQSCRDAGRASLFAHRSCWDGGILGSVPSQLRADGGIGSRWQPVTPFRREQAGGQNVGQFRKGGIFHSRGEVRRMQQVLCRCQRSRKGQGEIRRAFAKISSFHILASVCFLSSLSQKSPRLLPFYFPFLSLNVCVCL